MCILTALLMHFSDYMTIFNQGILSIVELYSHFSWSNIQHFTRHCTWTDMTLVKWIYFLLICSRQLCEWKCGGGPSFLHPSLYLLHLASLPVQSGGLTHMNHLSLQQWLTPFSSAPEINSISCCCCCGQQADLEIITHDNRRMWSTGSRDWGQAGRCNQENGGIKYNHSILLLCSD